MASKGTNNKKNRDWKQKKFERERWDLRSEYYRSHLAHDKVSDEVKNRFNRPAYGISKKVEDEKDNDD